MKNQYAIEMVPNKVYTINVPTNAAYKKLKRENLSLRRKLFCCAATLMLTLILLIVVTINSRMTISEMQEQVVVPTNSVKNIPVYENHDTVTATLLNDTTETVSSADTDMNNTTTIEEAPVTTEIDISKYSNVPLDSDVIKHLVETANSIGIPEEIMMAMAWRESTYTPSVVSASNDHGLMQINKCNFSTLAKNFDKTASEFAKDIYDPCFNIDCSAYILKNCMDTFGSDWHKVLMAYNMGPTGASNAIKNGNYSSSYSRAIIDYATSEFNYS